MSKPSTDRAAITQTLKALAEAGWTAHAVDQREDEPEKVATVQQAVKLVMEVDEAFVFVRRGEETGWVFFVLGNDPDEVICNHTVGLSDVLDPLMEGWWE